jgi:hypothetical protein
MATEFPRDFGIIPTDKPRSVVMDQTNPKDLLGMKKPRLSLIPPAGLVYGALALANGAEKYGPYNWREKKVQAMIYLEACMRHVLEFQDGADIDKEPTCIGCQEREAGTADKCRFGHSWLPHLGHAIACLLILVDAMETGNLVDNRPKAGPMSALIEKYTKKS